MSKHLASKHSQNTSDSRALQDHELDAVTGGLVVIAIIAVLIAPLIPDVKPIPKQP